MLIFDLLGTPNEEKIRKADAPNAAKKMGNSRRYPIRKDWENVKLHVMEKALIAKFQQHDDIRRILVNTGNAILIEHTKNGSPSSLRGFFLVLDFLLKIHIGLMEGMDRERICWESYSCACERSYWMARLHKI